MSHLDDKGNAKMVDITDKRPTKRTAASQCRVKVSSEIMKSLMENSLTKGDALQVSRIAAIQGAKCTSKLIPLCHNIPITGAEVHIALNEEDKEVIIQSYIYTNSNTGVEMEALMSTSIAALTIYDMCKSISHDIVITDIRLLRKTGGKSDFVSDKLN